MEILSISVDGKMAGELEGLKKRLGVKSRSKLVRMAVNALVREQNEMARLSGMTSAVFTVVYEKKPAELEQMLHEYSGCLRLDANAHSHNGCAEVLVIEADAKVIRSILARLRSMRGVKSVNCAVT